jgi:uncharacterized membrane protein YhiD involved in acid resistance
MEEVLAFQTLVNDNFEQVSITITIFNFLMCMAMSFVVRSFYIKNSYSLTSKMHIASVIPILAGVIFLVIVIVKSSLALSLGLVGALSIVRFRTPIKEPEELVYLFLTIAIGLGYGAGYTQVTTVITLAILIITYFTLSNRKTIKVNEYNLIIDWQNNELKLDFLIENVKKYTDSFKLIRFDTKKDLNTLVMNITPQINVSLDSLVSDLKIQDSNINVTIFEAKTNW